MPHKMHIYLILILKCQFNSKVQSKKSSFNQLQCLDLIVRIDFNPFKVKCLVKTTISLLILKRKTFMLWPILSTQFTRVCSIKQRFISQISGSCKTCFFPERKVWTKKSKNIFLIHLPSFGRYILCLMSLLTKKLSWGRRDLQIKRITLFFI